MFYEQADSTSWAGFSVSGEGFRGYLLRPLITVPFPKVRGGGLSKRHAFGRDGLEAGVQQLVPRGAGETSARILHRRYRDSGVPFYRPTTEGARGYTFEAQPDAKWPGRLP